MKYYINFTEYPENIPLNKALEWISNRTPPYSNSSLDKKGKKVKVTTNDEYAQDSNGIEVAMHEIYAHIKQGKIALSGIKHSKVSIKNTADWKEFTEWDVTSLRNSATFKGISEDEQPEWMTYKLNKWSDITNCHQHFKTMIGIFNRNNNKLSNIDQELMEWDFWFKLSEAEYDVLFTQSGMFYDMHVSFADLLKLYPEAEIDYSIKADVINGCCVYDDKAGLVNKMGRKSFAWDAFHAQVGYIIFKNGLPKHQQTLVFDMGDWAEKEWGFSPSSSAIKEKLKPYYDLIKPKNRK